MTASRLGSGMDSIMAMEITGPDGGGATVAEASTFLGFAAAGSSVSGIVALTAVLQPAERVATLRCMRWSASVPPGHTLFHFVM